MNNFTEGDIFHERYKLLKYLGGGELSEVWRVQDQLADIEVALKIYVRVGEVGIRQFIKDFTLTESLNHPYILKPHHVDVCDRRPYLILKFCTKGSVSNKIDEGNEEYKPFDEKDVATFMSQIGGALNYLHQNQILHRDVKPDNILLGDNGEYLLTDFGISKKAKTTLTKATSSTQVVSFSRPYAPPEILTGSEDPKKDIFSLGVTMYELLTEDLPFDGNGGTVLLMGGHIPDLPSKFTPELNAIIRQCMAKEINLRPTSQDLEIYGNTFLKTSKWPILKTSNTSTKQKITGLKAIKSDGPSVIQQFGNILSERSKALVGTINKVVETSNNFLKNITSNSDKIWSQYKTPILVSFGIVVIITTSILVFSKKNEKPVVVDAPKVDTLQVSIPTPREAPTEISLNPQQKYDSLMAQAEMSFSLKDYKNTMKLTKEALENKNDEAAKQLYEKAKKASFGESESIPDNKAYLERANTDMQNGSYKTALIFYKMACGNKPNKECKSKIEECLSKMNIKCLELLQQGKDAVNNNKSKAIDLFKQAKELSEAGDFFVPQFNETYQYYIKRADRLYDNEEFQDAKQWYQIAQVLNNTSDVQQKIQQCNK